jgi:hypothetical protein
VTSETFSEIIITKTEETRKCILYVKERKNERKFYSTNVPLISQINKRAGE